MASSSVVTLFNVQVLFYLVFSTHGFLIEDPCPTTPPCTCGSPDTHTIYCNDKHLTKFPTFTSSPRTYPSFAIYIQQNSMTLIPDDAFLPLAQNFNRSVFGSIDLRDNHISRISGQAFNGISDKIYRIYLSNNNLTTIPLALATLTNLDTVYIDGNPVSTLDFATVSAIGKTLRHLWIDMDNFFKWPSEMGALSKIFEVKMGAIRFSAIPNNAFAYWSNLGSLTIFNSNLDSLPAALCYVNSSYSIYFNLNTNINDSMNIFPDCQNVKARTDTLRAAAFKNNNLTGISNILSAFTSLQYLTVVGNPRMYFIENEHVPNNHSLSNIILDHNHFDRIPEALQKLNNLYSLDLSFNVISTIQRHDLDGFANLHVIKLQNNPIVYVSSDAFISSVQLKTIYLQNTNLTKIPQGVVSLHNLTQLDLEGSPIRCTCNAMSHLRTWTDRVYWFSSCNGTCIYLNGHCDLSQKNIGDYVKNTLTKCP